MREIRSSPQQLIALAVSGGLVFLIGAMIASTSHGVRVQLIIAGAAVGLLGAYALISSAGQVAANRRAENLQDEIDQLRVGDAALRSRMALTLREPLATIVGFTDKMADTPELSHDQRHDLLITIRDNAREVERVLANLAPVDAAGNASAHVPGVVLLDEEVHAVASAIQTDTVFESDLDKARAWADSAHVRQLLRTLIRGAQHGGCAQITLRTEQRAGRATLTISGRDQLLSIEGIAALTGNTQTSDAGSDAYISLKNAHNLAAEMEGSIGYAEAFGLSHIVLDLPAPPEDLGLQAPRQLAPNGFDAPFGSGTGLHSKRSTMSVRFT